MPITSANRVVAQPVSWLWPGRIPLGKLVILDGNPDLGKSLLALDWCARLSTGRPFPESTVVPEPASALVLSAEDAPQDTIVPRLERLGADMSQVFVWQSEREEEQWPWQFPRDLDKLEAVLCRTRARLVVLDPLMAFLDESVLYISDHSVRRALGPLMQVAQKHHCALLMLRHLRKHGTTQAFYRGLGSIAFMAVCRYSMLVERDPKIPSRCVLAQVRSSLSGCLPSLAYEITAKNGGPPTVNWLGKSPYSANDLLFQMGRRPKESAQAADFLEHFLAGGPRTSRQVLKAAEKAQVSLRTLERAKKELDVRCRREYLAGKPVSYWLLDGQELGPEHYDGYEIERMIREWQRPLPGAGSEEKEE
jgi:hypothetical protein